MWLHGAACTVAFYYMAGLRMNDQKNAIAVTMIIVTAFKICTVLATEKTGS
jgi:hypothetical protein